MGRETWGHRPDVHRFLGKLSNRDKAGLPVIGGGFPGPSALSWGSGTRSRLLKGLHEILTFLWTPGVRGVPQHVAHLILVANKKCRDPLGRLGAGSSLGVVRFARDSAASG